MDLIALFLYEKNLTVPRIRDKNLPGDQSLGST